MSFVVSTFDSICFFFVLLLFGMNGRVARDDGEPIAGRERFVRTKAKQEWPTLSTSIYQE